MLKNLKITKTGIICFIIMLAGILLRFCFYSYNRPFWNDECALAFSIVNFNLLGCFKALVYGQATPPFFLIISEFFYKIIPDIELSLRFFPLISSVLSIFVFYNLSRKILTKKCSVFLALVLFCFNYRLLYFSQEFKQYSSDVLIFLLIFLSYFYINIKNLKIKLILLIGFSYAFCIWLSFTSLMALFSIFFILLIKNKKDYKKIFLLFLPTIISFALFYFFQQHLNSSAFLHTYWKEGFIDRNFHNLFFVLSNYFSYSFNSIIIYLMFFLGLILNLSKIKNGKSEKSLILLVPFLLALILSYFSIYPLESRVSLYLIPVCILFAAGIIDFFNIKNKFLNYALSGIIIFIVSYPTIADSTHKIFSKEINMENIISPLNITSKLIKNDDILYIPDGSKISYEFYKNDFKFKNVIIETQRINDSKEYIKTLGKLPKNKTYYYVYCHFPEKQKRLKDVYLWAKNKKDFKIFADKNANALIIFTQ